MSACEWCYTAAEWCADTPRHGFIELCQLHYDELQRALRAERLAQLTPMALELLAVTI